MQEITTKLSKTRKALIIAIPVILVLFIWLAREALLPGPVSILDQEIEDLLYQGRVPFIASFFYFFTFLADKYLISLLTIAIIGYLYMKKRFSYMVGFLVAIVGSAITTELLKISLERTRPLSPIPFYPEDSFSFPSWHATGAVAFYVFLAYIIYNLSDRKLFRNLALILAPIIILALGFSRLYLGVHFPSDVLAGFMLGAIWVMIGILINKVDE